MPINVEAEREQIEQLRRSALNGHRADREPMVICASGVTPERVSWIWPGRLARGKITLLEGDPGLGKSTITLDIAARLSRGTPLPDSAITLPPMGTLFLSAEDGVSDTMVPRLIAAGADLSRIHILEGVRRADDSEEGVQIPRDLDLIADLMRERHLGLVVVDPLSVFLDDNISENRNQEIRKALAPAKKMLEQSGVSGIFLRHLTKSSSANPVYRGVGSIGLGGAARIVLMVGKDPESDEIRILAEVKNNLSQPMPSLAFRVVSNALDPMTGEIDWLGVTRWNAKDLQATMDDEDRDSLTESAEWLLGELCGVPSVSAKVLERGAKDAGFSWRTVNRAKKKIGATSSRDGVTWGWAMDQSSTLCQGRPAAHVKTVFAVNGVKDAPPF